MAKRNVLELLITGDASDLDKALGGVEKKLDAFAKRAKDVGETLSTRLTLPLAIAGGAAIKLATDFNESLNKVDVAFKSSSAEVQSFAKTTLKSFGIAEGTALDMAALFGDMATSMGLSTQQSAVLSTSLVGLAGDLASFKNMNIEEVTTALNGIFTGETESLKRLGVVMTEVNLKQFAMEQGIKKTYDQMTQGEKVLLRYQYVMKSTANAHGDFERTGGGAANQMRMFGESMKELGVLFGQIVLPTVTEIIKYFNDMLLKIKDLSPETKKWILVLGGVAAVTGPMLYLAGTVLPNMITGFKLLTAAAVKFNLTAGSGSAIAVLATMMGYAAKSAYDYSSAQVDLVKKNNDVKASEKDSANSIYEKNKAIYAQIAAIDKQIAQQKGTKVGQFGQAIVVSDEMLKKSKNQLISQLHTNRLWLEELKNQKPKGKADGALDDVFGGDGTAKATKETTLEVKKSLMSLQEDVDKHREGTLALHKELLALRGFGPQESLALPAFQGTKVDTAAILTPFQLMNQQVTAYAQNQEETLTALNEAYTVHMQSAQFLADGLGSMFVNLGNGLVESLGLAKTGIEGIMGAMLNMVVQMGAAVIKEAIINKAKQAFVAKTAMANAVLIGTNAAVASGPAGLLTLGPAIAGAMGQVGAAMAGVTAFANGGIVSGPTMGLVGEYPGAKSNPEVIAPLNKLQSMLDGGGSNVNVSGEFVVRGQDLILALQRAEKQKSRIG